MSRKSWRSLVSFIFSWFLIFIQYVLLTYTKMYIICWNSLVVHQSATICNIYYVVSVYDKDCLFWFVYSKIDMWDIVIFAVNVYHVSIIVYICEYIKFNDMNIIVISWNWLSRNTDCTILSLFIIYQVIYYWIETLVKFFVSL